MNANVTKVAKKVLKKVPTRAIDAGAALVFRKAFAKNPAKTLRVVSTLAVIVLGHTILEWASKD